MFYNLLDRTPSVAAVWLNPCHQCYVRPPGSHFGSSSIATVTHPGSCKLFNLLLLLSSVRSLVCVISSQLSRDGQDDREIETIRRERESTLGGWHWDRRDPHDDRQTTRGWKNGHASTHSLSLVVWSHLEGNLCIVMMKREREQCRGI